MVPDVVAGGCCLAPALNSVCSTKTVRSSASAAGTMLSCARSRSSDNASPSLSDSLAASEKMQL